MSTLTKIRYALVSRACVIGAAVIDWFDGRVLMRLFAMRVRGARTDALYNVVVNTSLDLMGLAARLDDIAHTAELRILDIERQELDAWLKEEWDEYRRVMRNAETIEEEETNEAYMDHIVDMYGADVELLNDARRRVTTRFGMDWRM
jgi:hypothetical protein